MAKNATKMRHFQAKISKIFCPLSEIINTPLVVAPTNRRFHFRQYTIEATDEWSTD